MRIVDTRPKDDGYDDLHSCPVCNEITTNRVDWECIEENGACEACCLASWRKASKEGNANDWATELTDQDIPF